MKLFGRDLFAPRKPKYPYYLGLALGGGGAKGFFEAGVLRSLLDRGYQPDLLAGVSAGSLVGVLYADGFAPEDMLEMFQVLEVRSFVKVTFPKESLFDIDPVRQLLKKNLRARRFEDLKIPLKVIATNLHNGEATLFDSGELIEPVIASCSIPVIFKPVEINGTLYVDGGVVNNLPVTPIRSLCEKVFAVNNHPQQVGDVKRTMPQIARRAVGYMFNSNTDDDKRMADLLFEDPELLAFESYDLKYGNEMYQLGLRVANEMLDHYSLE